MEVVVTTGAISRAKLQSIHHTNKPTPSFFADRMPFLSPNQQYQSTESIYSRSCAFRGHSPPDVKAWEPQTHKNLGSINLFHPSCRM